jgi:hypothetical protein
VIELFGAQVAILDFAPNAFLFINIVSKSP